MKSPAQFGKKMFTPRHNFTRKPAFSLMTMGLVSGLLLAQANAATITWNGSGATADMATSSNWLPTTATIGGNTNDYVFSGATAAAAVTNSAISATAASITFSADAAAYTISGNAITLAGNITNNSSNIETLNVPLLLSGTGSLYGGTGSLVIGGAISGTGRINVNGTVTFSGSSNYSGTTALAAGATAIIGNDSAFGSSSIVSSGSAVLKVNGEARTIANTILLTNTINLAGSSDITLTGSGGNPAVTVTSYANNSMLVTNTGITTISGVFSLKNSSTGINNGSAFLKLGSSANVVLTGAITDNNSGNSTTSTGGASLAIDFNGTGSNITINPTSTNNSYGYGTTSSGTSSISANVQGYNTVTVGGPGGAGATITPFGNTVVFLNNSKLFFFQAATDGQILANSFKGGASSIGFGFSGSNSLTLSGSYTPTSAVAITNIASGTLTLGNIISMAASTNNKLSIVGWGDTVFSASSLLTGTTSQFVKTGSGVLTLSGSINVNGVMTLTGGTVILDYSETSAGGGNSTRLTGTSSGANLVLAGVNLQLSGGSYVQNVVSGSTSLGTGQSSITQTNAGSSTINLGVLSRSVYNGATLDVGTGVASTTTANTNGILGGWATVNGSDWAVGSGTSGVAATITAYSGYVSGSSFSVGADTNNNLVTGNASVSGDGTWQTNTLKILPTSAGQSMSIASTGTVKLKGGGILFTGGYDYTISGGSLIGSNGSDLVINQYGTGVLTISSAIVGTAATSDFSLIKTGSGTLQLNGTNSYTKGTFFNGGTVRVTSDLNLGASSGSLTFNGGTLEMMSDGFSSARYVILGANGGTIQVDAGIATLSGVVSGTSYGCLTKAGNGTLILTGTNTYQGPTNINEGTLQLGNALALGPSAVSVNCSVAPINVNGGTLDIAGYTASVGNIVLTNGNIIDSVGGGKLNAYSYTLQSGTVGAVMGDLTVTNAVSSSINLYKTTSGTVVLAGNNTYSGATQIQAGTLQIGNGGTVGQLGSGDVTNNGNLAFDRSDTYTVSNGIMGSGSVTQEGTGKTILEGLNTYTGATQVNGGELDVNSSLAADSTVTVMGATLGGRGTINGITTVADGSIKGSGLRLVGAATFTGNSSISGTTTFSGGIVAQSGTLALTGTATGAVKVQSFAKFTNDGTVTGNVDVSGVMSGSGTVVGAVSVHDGGVLAIEKDIITGDLTLDSGSKITMTLSSLTDYSGISVSGAVTLGGTLELTLGTISEGDKFVLIDNTGALLISSTFSSIIVNGKSIALSSSNTFTVGSMVYGLTYNGTSDNDLTMTALAAVPEPSTWAIVVGGMGMLIGLSRRGQRRQC